MTAYYNEFDQAAAAVLRQQIADGVIAPGDVDTRSIKEVTPDDVRGYTQCHFFAGGGLWSVAARLAGWPDDCPIWTGSCPCQPFSGAGKGLGTDDPRHLWPDFHRLIRAGRPAVVMGEQVAAKAGYGWFDGVRADLAGEGYAARAVDFPACSVDAPHQRNRLYWVAVAGHVADDDRAGSAAHGRNAGEVGCFPFAQRRPENDAAISRRGDDPAVGRLPGAIPLEHGAGIGRGEGRAEHGLLGGRGAAAGTDAQGSSLSSNAVVPLFQGQPPARHEPDAGTDEGVHADADRPWRLQSQGRFAEQRGRAGDGHDRRNGTYWSDAEWIACHDNKARRAQPGIRFLVDGLPGRVDLWRVGGNAIVPQAAAEVIASFIDAYGLPAAVETRQAA